MVSATCCQKLLFQPKFHPIRPKILEWCRNIRAKEPAYFGQKCTFHPKCQNETWGICTEMFRLNIRSAKTPPKIRSVRHYCLATHSINVWTVLLCLPGRGQSRFIVYWCCDAVLRGRSCPLWPKSIFCSLLSFVSTLMELSPWDFVQHMVVLLELAWPIPLASCVLSNTPYFGEH